MAKTLELGGIQVAPGERKAGRLTVGDFADGSVLTVPFIIANGAADGPILFLQSAVHGDEVIGSFVARHIAMSVDLAHLSGAVIAVPVANVGAFLSRSRGFTLEERPNQNMNRAFPGNAHGLLTERTAYVIFHELAQHASHAIDFHTALQGADIYPFTYVIQMSDEDRTVKVKEEMAQAFGAPMTFYLSPESAKGHEVFSGDYTRSFTEQCRLRGIPAIMAEMGEGSRLNRDYVEVGVTGVTNVMKKLGMLKGPMETRPTKRFSRINAVRVERGGLLELAVQLGASVKEGDLLGRVYRLTGEVDDVRCRANGTVLRALTTAIVFTGAEAAWVVS